MTREYRLFWTAGGAPPGGIPVTADLPAGWTETLDAMQSPRFDVPGMSAGLVAIVAIHAAGATDAERLEWAFAQQFAAPAEVTRAPRPDGRLWAVHTPGGRLHARMFLRAPHDSIVMASAMTFTPAPAAWLAELERVLDTVRVG